MGMRFEKRGLAAQVVAVIIATTFFISIFDLSFVNAKAMSAAQRRQEILEQQQAEQETQAKRTQEEQSANAEVDNAIAESIASRNDLGTATYLRATTSTDTSGIKASKVAKGYRYVDLKWTKAKNAKEYAVFYSYEKNGEYKKKGAVVDTNKKTKILFKNDREIFLKVRAINGSAQSDLSEAVVIWPGYGDQVNAMKIKYSKSASTLFSGSEKKFKINSTASMLKTYKTKWESSNSDVAKVSKSGKVTALKAGTATITARSHTGFKTKETLLVKTTTPSGVPDVVGMDTSDAKKALQAAGFNVKVKSKYIKKKTLKKKYPGVKMGNVFKQSVAGGTQVQKGTTITITKGDEIYDCGVGVEAMVKWAIKVAEDDSYGYSMGVYTGRGLDRLCPYTNEGASKDYDCATFVNAALAYSGMGDDYMKATHKPSPVVGGVKALMIKNGWKKVLVNGKKPTVSQLKRGDIVLDVRRHIQIHVGNGKDVGAHNNYDGKSGDSSGREVSVNWSWTGYAEVYRYKGSIGK